MGLTTHDFYYDLPEELIAARPLPQRAASRMMVLRRDLGTIEHHHFSELPSLLRRDDLLVLNDTRVIPARVFSDDGKIELLFLEQPAPCQWRCLVRPGKKMKPGRTLQVGGVSGEVLEIFENGDRLIGWENEIDLNQYGHLALPHYMGREEELADQERYQTVYAKHEGAIAAPTAGLHFTPELLAKLPHAFLTLHVGVGTFRPVKATRPEEHVMHSEKFHITQETALRINQASRVIAVGTTVTRVLEHLAREIPLESEERIPNAERSGETDIFLYPPYKLRGIDGLLTNFHLPESTLIMLVSAFAGREFVLRAYREAVEKKYRFYSYGDCMLVL